MREKRNEILLHEKLLVLLEMSELPLEQKVQITTSSNNQVRAETVSFGGVCTAKTISVEISAVTMHIN